MNLTRMNAIVLATAATVASCDVHAGTPALVELGRHVPGYDVSGPAHIAIADFDGDGRDDLVLPAQSGTALFQVLGQSSSGIVSKQVVFLPDVALAGVSVATVGGEPQLVTVSQDGVTRRFAGWPLVEVHAFDMELDDVASAAIGDIDNDGALELVTTSGYFTTSLEARTLLDGQPRWSLPMVGGNSVLLRQFDADPALEIVVAGTPGRVIDGATQGTDWSYKDGFGRFLAAGELQPGGGLELAAADSWGPIVGFQSAPWSPVWDLEQFDVFALATADFDDDGFDEIIEADGPWGSINIIDGQTHAIRLSIPQDGDGISSIDAWDHDDDGNADVAFAAYDPTWTDKPLFRLSDSEDGTTIWELLADERPAYQRLALARTPAGFGLVYPFGTETARGGWTGMDAASGQENWRSPFAVDNDHPFYMVPRETAYATDGTRLVVAGNAYGNGARFVALDAVSHAQLWMLDGETRPELLNRSVAGMTVLDIAGSWTIAACVDSGVGKRLLLIDGATGTFLWNSVSMADGGFQCGIIAGHFADGENPLVVSVLESSLRAYDAVTHLLVWTLPGAADGASLVEHGVAGRELIVFEGSELRFHDAETRAFIRSFEVDPYITAVHAVGGDVHRLVVAAGGRLLLVDGANGDILHTSDYLGDVLADGNRIATLDLGGGYSLIAVGSRGGVFRYRLYTGEAIFTDGFEPVVD